MLIMNQLFTERPLLKTGILGLLFLPFIILINAYSPPGEKIPEGYSSTILAFEFASNDEELVEVLGPLETNEIQDLNRMNYLDFGFMVIYGIFLFIFMARLGGITGSKLLLRGRWIVAVIVLSDALENVQLLKLTDRFMEANAELSDTLVLLGVFTWTKWLLLAIAISLIARVMTRMRKSQWLGYILYAPLGIGVGSFILGEQRAEDLFGTSVFIAFFLIFIYCYIYRIQKSR